MEQRVRILKTHRYLALHDNYISPLSSGDCAVIRHPGQVPPGGTRAGIQKNLIILYFRWIPDLIRLGGLVRNDGIGWLRDSFRGDNGPLRS